MKIDIRTVLLPLLLFAFCSCRSTQTQQPKEYADYSERSDFVVKNADSVNLDNLVVLGKVWGFAKYHHPVFADSIYNIDYELFELLPKVAYVGKDECNAILFDWVNGLGEFKNVEAKYLKEIKDNNYIPAADTDWICDVELLGEELSGLLQNLRYAKRRKPSRYAQMIQDKYVNFNVEARAGPFSAKDTGYNILTLFRLWNMAEYYFPSVNITDKKWADVLEEYVPKFLKTDHIYWTMAELIAELCDTHSFMSDNPVHFDNRMPVELKYVENKLIVTDNRKFITKDEESDFELGDEIISIEGHSPDYFIDRARRFVSASNESVLLRNAAELAGFIYDEEALVEVKRGGRHMKFLVGTIRAQEYYTRDENWTKGRTYYKLLNDTIGYLYPAKYKNADAATIMSKFKDTKAIIIDFRCYPSDFMPFEFVGKYFVPQEIRYVIFTEPVKALPGYYAKLPTSLGKKNKDYYKGLIVVLVNETTQSSAEYQTMAFQACPNTIVVGSQTAGADGNAAWIPLPRGVKTLFSGLGVYYPDGTNTQRTGVRIDYYAELTVEGIKAGRDEVMEKALEVIGSSL